MPRRPFMLLLALVPVACGDPSPIEDDGTATTDDSGGPLLADDPVIVRHDQQPMVVDVRLTLTRPAIATAMLTGAVDPGVKTASLTGAEPTTEPVVRLRGLAPSTSYAIEIELAEPGRAPDHAAATFTTLPPLPGFIAEFPVEGPGPASVEYRMFDVTSFAVLEAQALFVIDPAGTTRWYHPTPGAGASTLAAVAGAKLMADGTVVYLQDATLHVVDELGQKLVAIAGPGLGIPALHHDVLPLDSGNFLVFSRAFRDIYYPDDDATYHVAADTIVELSRAGEIVWTWDAFDHLDPQRILPGFHSLAPILDPETKQPGKDWTHANGMALAADGHLLVSLRHQDWILKIDRETGAILWRLGEDGDFTLTSGTWFHHQHSPEPQADGSILLYDNDVDNPNEPAAEENARPVRYLLDENAMTATLVWEEINETYTSPVAGDADRLENGNILVLDSSIPLAPPNLLPVYWRLREVDPRTNTWTWTIRGSDEWAAYRAFPVDRLPGEVD